MRFHARAEGRFFQAEDGIRDVERSRGLGDVYKRQSLTRPFWALPRENNVNNADSNIKF